MSWAFLEDFAPEAILLLGVIGCLAADWFSARGRRLRPDQT